MSDLVIIPDVEGDHVLGAYDRLRSTGLRVSISTGATIGDPGTHDGRNTQVVTVDPSAGALVSAESAVTLGIGAYPFYLLGSPVVPIPLPTYTVPDFASSYVSAPAEGAVGRVGFTVYLGRLTAADAPHLYENYRVVRQEPSPGAALSVVERIFGGVRLTPLRVWGEQVERRPPMLT
jgi:PASTA domain